MTYILHPNNRKVGKKNDSSLKFYLFTQTNLPNKLTVGIQKYFESIITEVITVPFIVG